MIANLLKSSNRHFIKKFVCTDKNLPLFQLIVDYLMDSSIEQTLSLENISVLQFLSKYSNVDFGKYLIQIISLLHQYYQESSQLTELNHTLNILSSSIENGGLLPSQQSELVKLLMIFIIKYPEAITVSSMECLANICAKIMSVQIATDILDKFIPLFESPSFSSKCRALINVSNLSYYLFKKKLFTSEKISEIFNIILQTIPKDESIFENENLSFAYFRSLERFVQCVPLLGTKILWIINHFLLPERKNHESFVALKFFYELMENFENTPSSKLYLSPTKPISNDVTSDIGSTSYCSALIQSHLMGILQCSLRNSLDIQSTSILLFECLFSNGIIHPIELVPFVVGLCASSYSFVSNNSLILFESMQERHKSLLLNSNPLNSLHSIYKVNPSYIDISFLYSFYNQKKVKRNNFFKVCLSLFDFSTSNHKTYCKNPESNSFIFFIARIFGNIYFSKYDELLFFLHSLNLVCSVLISYIESITDQEESNELNNKLMVIYGYLCYELRKHIVHSYGIETSKIETYSTSLKENTKAFDKPCCKIKNSEDYIQRYHEISVALSQPLENLLAELHCLIDYDGTEELIPAKRHKK